MVHTRHVYVVDDDSMVRTSAVFFLRSAGYTAHPFRCGREFLDAASNCKPGCVLLDIRMPEIDGMQVIEKLDDRIIQLPVIVMTGHGDIATAVRAMKLGASDFLEKPFEEEAVLEAIERVFANLGQHVIAADRCAEAKQRLESLTKRENDVLLGLASGLSNKVLAYRLSLSVRTVEMHRSNMMARLAVRSLPEALRLAYLAGAVPPAPQPEPRTH